MTEYLFAFCLNVLLSAGIVTYLLISLNSEGKFTEGKIFNWSKTSIAFILILMSALLFANSNTIVKVTLNSLVIIAAAYWVYGSELAYSIISTVYLYIIYIVGDTAAYLAVNQLFNVTTAEDIRKSTSITLIVLIVIFLITAGIMRITQKRILSIKTVLHKSNKKLKAIISLSIVGFLFALSFQGYIHNYIHFHMKDLLQNRQISLITLGISMLFATLILVILYVFDIFTKQKQEYDLFKKISKYDEMTGILNKYAGLKYIESLLEVAKIKSHSLTVCFVDINNLKEVNDSYGHNEGDNLIKDIISVIKNTLRSTDIVFRYGGDEFIIVFAKSDAAKAKTVWRRIQNQIDRLNSEPSIKYKLSISHGFSEYVPGNDISVDELLKKADKEMYEDKRLYKKAALEA